MEINITLDVQGATVEEVQWLAGLLAAQRTAPAPITVEVEKAAPTAPADEEKPAPKKAAAKKPAAKKTAKKADPAPEPTPEPTAPAEDETDGATLSDADAPDEEALKAQAIERATALLAEEGGAGTVRAALKAVGARRVSALAGDDIRAFLDALPEA